MWWNHNHNHFHFSCVRGAPERSKAWEAWGLSVPPCGASAPARVQFPPAAHHRCQASLHKLMGTLQHICSVRLLQVRASHPHHIQSPVWLCVRAFAVLQHLSWPSPILATNMNFADWINAPVP